MKNPPREPAPAPAKATRALSGNKSVFIAGALALSAWAFFGTSQAAEEAVRIPAPTADIMAADAAAGPQTAVFAGGCFWGVQGVFQHTRGVLGAVSGYAGGEQRTARYEEVSGGRTGHAESVQITFDPKQVSYGQLLQIYFSVAHDPTQRNRQGPDTGTQYRSAVFFTSPAQQKVAQAYIGQLDAAHAFKAPIVTELSPLKAFYPAEAYHQDYATLHPESGYIATFDLPKIANLQAMLPQFFRVKPVLVGKNPPNA